MEKDGFEMNDRMKMDGMRSVKRIHTTAEGLLQVGADDEIQEAFEGAKAFFGHVSGIRPWQGRCLVHPSKCQVMCSI